MQISYRRIYPEMKKYLYVVVPVKGTAGCWSRAVFPISRLYAMTLSRLVPARL